MPNYRFDSQQNKEFKDAKQKKLGVLTLSRMGLETEKRKQKSRKLPRDKKKLSTTRKAHCNIRSV